MDPQTAYMFLKKRAIFHRWHITRDSYNPRDDGEVDISFACMRKTNKGYEAVGLEKHSPAIVKYIAADSCGHSKTKELSNLGLDAAVRETYKLVLKK